MIRIGLSGNGAIQGLGRIEINRTIVFIPEYGKWDKWNCISYAINAQGDGSMQLGLNIFWSTVQGLQHMG